jgi:hypothetical protein
MFDPKYISTWHISAVAALLAACSPSPDRHDPDGNGGLTVPSATLKPLDNDVPVKPDLIQVTIILREDGLLIETPGHARPLKFGEATPAEVEEALAAFGSPQQSSNSECPAGPLTFMEWTNGLQAAFQDGKFAGWWASEKARGIATGDGLRPGSPRTAVGAAKVEDTSIGKLFTIDGVNGVLDEASGTKVTALWAGAACIFS